MPIDLEEHKVYIEATKMDMVPYSVAMQALKEAANVDVEKYTKDLEFAMTELHRALNNVKIDE